MWYDESERIGMQKCTPAGYAVRVFAELIYLIGLLTVLLVPAMWLHAGIKGTFRVSLLWMMALPPSLVVLGVAMYRYSCWLAGRKDFQFDYKRSEASWIEAGERRTYKYGA